MRITNAKVFIGREFVDGGIEFDEKFISIGKIEGEAFDAQGCYIIPGLIDIHTHAAMGADASDGDIDGMNTMSKYYASLGVTSWCPTTMTLKEDTLSVAMETIKNFRREEAGAKVAGINLEGPFVCYAKRGAQAAENIHTPDSQMFNRLNEKSGGIIKLVTVAPEEPNAMEFIKEVSKICTVSLGHTSADYYTAVMAYENGASHATHLFNAMPSLHHREPGVIAAASDYGATVELITDGFHVHPSVIRLTNRLFRDKLILISDSLRCAGMPDGDYTLGGQPITMAGGKAVLSGTDTLAGSSIHLMEGMRRSVKFGITLENAVYAASTAPAKVIGATDIGSIEKGKFADFVMLDKDLNVKKVFINGKPVYEY